jgi:hypothetical protein
LRERAIASVSPVILVVAIAITWVDTTGVIGAAGLVYATGSVDLAIVNTATIAVFLAGFALSCHGSCIQYKKGHTNKNPSAIHRESAH